MKYKEYGKYTLICDICGASSEEEYENFQAAKDAGKNLGWKSRKIDGDWADICPECFEMD